MDRDTFVLNPIDRAAAHRTSAPLVRESEIKQNLKPIKSTQLSPIARMQMEQKHVQEKRNTIMNGMMDTVNNL